MNTNDNNTLLADTAVVAAPALLKHRSTIKRRSFGRSVVRLLKQQRIAPPASDAADGGRVKAYKKKDVPADRDTEAGDATTTTTSRIRTTMAERARALNGRARGSINRDVENLRGWLKHTTANIDAVLRTADLRSSISSEINAFGSGVRKSISIASHGLEAFIEAAKLAGRKQLALATRQMRRLSAGRRSFVDATTRDRDALAGEHEVPCLDPSSSVMTERMSSIKDWIPYSGENLHLRLLSAASTLVGEDVDAGKMVEQQQLFVIPKIIVDDYDELMDPFGMYEGVGLLFAEAKAPVFRPRREARERYPGMMTGYE